ncbi:MAG: recombination mediator RecR [Firmicutes bacterium]|nr:recombination mediator RecR [Bacillota bacterium]
MENIDPIERLVSAFRSLPGVGLKTAERYAYSIIKNDEENAKEFAESILNAKLKVKYCKECGNYTDGEICAICAKRNPDIICVVKEPKDVVAMEKVKNFNGVYHVLHGTINPLENRGPNDIRIKELLERVNRLKTKEVIMATNPDVEGEATALYIARLLKPLGIKVTRLAQGISMGSELEYADEVTLTKALEKRSEI